MKLKKKLAHSDWITSFMANIIFSRVLRDSTPRLVCPLVGWSPFYFFGVFEQFELTAPAQIPQ